MSLHITHYDTHCHNQQPATMAVPAVMASPWKAATAPDGQTYYCCRGRLTIRQSGLALLIFVFQKID